MKQLKKAYLEITNLCNLNCSFCVGTRRPGGMMSPADFRALASRIRPHTQYLYLHLMGEPLLHRELEEILAIAAELDFRVMLTTNGTLLPERQELLCASPAIHRISISVHSFEGNDAAASPDAYLDGCVAFAKAAVAAGKRCVFRLCNLDGAETRGENTLNDSILARLERSFPKPWKDDPRGMTLADRVHLEWGERFEWPDLSAREGGCAGFCYGLRDQVGILCDGTVVPCCLDHEGDVALGNLFEQTMEEILNGPRARAIYDGFSRGVAVEELCRKCGYARRFRR